MCGLLNGMVNSSGEREAGEWSKMGPHDEFLELCAVSTSGDLTEEEQNKLKAHLAGCPDCRQALKEFEAAVDIGVPFLASKLSTVAFRRVRIILKRNWPNRRYRKARLRSQVTTRKPVFRTGEEKRGFAFAAEKWRMRERAGELELCVDAVCCLHPAHDRIGDLLRTELGKITSTEVARIDFRITPMVELRP